MAEEDYAKYLVKGSAITFGAMVATAIIGIVLRILLARTLSPEDYGLLFAIITFVSFFTPFQHIGLRGAIAKFIPEFKAKGRLDDIKSSISTALVIQIILTATLTLIFIALSGWLSTSFFGTPDAKPILIILIVWFAVMMTLDFLRVIFQGFRDMAGRSGIKLSRMVFTLGIVSTVVFFLGGGLMGIASGYLAASIITGVIFFTLLQKRHSDLLRGKGTLKKTLAKKLLAFGLPLLFAGIAGTVMARVDTIMITAFRSLQDVGLYQVARPTTQFLGFFGLAISIPLMPMVSELWAKKKKEKIRSTLHFLTKFSLVLIIPFALIFLAFPDTVIKLLFGAEYLPATTALQVLSVGIIFLAGTRIFGPTLTGIGQPTLVLKSMGVAVIFNVIANLLLVPPHGAGGAAIATSSSFLIALFLQFHFVRKIIVFPVPVSDILKTLAGGGVTLLLVFILKRVLVLPLWPAFFTVMIPAILFYSIWILRTGVIVKKDLDLVDRTTPIPKQLIRTVKKLAVR